MLREARWGEEAIEKEMVDFMNYVYPKIEEPEEVVNIPTTTVEKIADRFKKKRGSS